MKDMPIDTISLIVHKEDCLREWNIDKFVNCIDVIEYGENIHYGYVFIRGRLRNLIVCIRESYLKITGSISKYHFEDDFRTLTIEDVTNVIEEIGNELGISLWKGYIQRIDVARNIIVEKNPMDYINCFEETPGYYKDTHNTRLLFKRNNGTSAINIYDKIKEIKSKRRESKSIVRKLEFLNKKILRFEVQLQKKINKQIQYKYVRVVHLRSETFADRLSDIWYASFKTLRTKKKLGFKAISNCEEFKRNIYAKGILSIGIKNLYDEIENLRKDGILSSNQKYYLKKDFEKALKTSNSLTELNHMVELEQKITFLHQGLPDEEYKALVEELQKFTAIDNLLLVNNAKSNNTK